MGFIDDHQTWKGLKNGDLEALSSIFITHYDALFYYGRKFIFNEEVVKDCIQDLFCKLWDRRQHLKDPVLLKPYLFKSLRNLINDELRKKQKHQLFQTEQSSYPEIIFSHEDFLVREQISLEQTQKLQATLQQLSNRQREAIHLRFFNDFSYEHISEIMSLNLQSVRNLISQALKILRESLLLFVVIIPLLF